MSNELYIVANSYNSISPGVYVFKTQEEAERMAANIAARAKAANESARVSIKKITYLDTPYPGTENISDSFNQDHNITYTEKAA